jgi:hypothetical protein
LKKFVNGSDLFHKNNYLHQAVRLLKAEQVSHLNVNMVSIEYFMPRTYCLLFSASYKHITTNM